jgi:hypothetical protein
MNFGGKSFGQLLPHTIEFKRQQNKSIDEVIKEVEADPRAFAVKAPHTD